MPGHYIPSRPRSTMSDDDEGDDKPAPISIRLVRERRKTPDLPKPDKPKPNDNFYHAWDSFLSKSSHKTKSTSALAKRVARTRQAAATDENGLSLKENSATSYEQAKAECQAKVRAIVTECKRLNQKYYDRHFDLECFQHDCLFPLDRSGFEKGTNLPSAVKRVEDIFENPQFNEHKACADDVVQGQLGDCWFLASLMSIAAREGMVSRLCVDRDEAVGVYGFVFFRDGEWYPEVIDDRLFIHVSDGEDLFVGKYVPDEKSYSKREVGTINTGYNIQKLRDTLQKGGEALFFARCRSDSDSTWLPLLEKAYAKAHGDYFSTHGGQPGEGIEDLCGGVSTSIKSSQIMSKDQFWEDLKEVNTKYLFAGAATHWESLDKAAFHAYAVLQIAEHGDLRLLKIRDPWGRHQDDGPWTYSFSEWTAELVEKLKYDFKDPGVFWISYKNFLKHFYAIQRTRLFNDNWKLTSQWTSVNVPAIPDYLDTRFEFALSEKGPVVVVLCQPDSRYFKGLEGRYEYALHFRIYNHKERSTYRARSMHTSGGNNSCTRSVSADLELEAGTYEVLVKVTADRYLGLTSCGAVVPEYKWQQEKLLQVGRNFDLAHSKGKRREKESSNREQQAADERQRKRDANAKARRLRQAEKERLQKRKDRVAAEEERRATKELLQRAKKALPTGVSIVDTRGSESASKDGCTSELEDDSFSWDSGIDGSAHGSDSEKEDDIWADDPWNAVCVLGLRVYSHSDVRISVVEDDREEEDGKKGDQM